MTDWPDTVVGMREAVVKGTLSAAEICRTPLDRIRATDRSLRQATS